MKMKSYLAAASAAMLIGSAGLAHATTCLDTDVSPTAVACAGFVSGNVLNNGHLSDQKTELGLMGFTWDESTVVKPNFSLNKATTINFGETLYGDIFIGVHYGNGQGGPGNATAFYEFDAGKTGLSSIDLNYANSSDAVIYAGSTTPPTSPAPEPATWAMMVLGLGVLGAALRLQRRATLAAA